MLSLNKKIDINIMSDINITTVKSHTQVMELINLSKSELLLKCLDLGFTKCKSKNKTQLIELISSKNSICETIIKCAITNPSTHKYTFIEVCAGGGGLSSGLIKSGFTPLLFISVWMHLNTMFRKKEKGFL